jgi:O-antigen ligase
MEKRDSIPLNPQFSPPRSLTSSISEENETVPFGESVAASTRWLSMVVLALGLVVTQVLIGGARMVFSLPGYFLIGLAGVLLLFSHVSGRIPRKAWPCFTTTLLFGGYIIGRSLGAPINYLARTDFYMAVGALLVYGIMAIHFSNPRWRIGLVATLLVCAIAHVIVGAVQFREANNFMLLPGIFRPDYEWRASGFYICPNHLAGLLEMVGLMALSIACWGRYRVGPRILLGYGAAVCLAGITLTGSRGGYLATILGLAVFAMVSLWVVRQVRPDRFAALCAVFIAGLALLIGTTLFVMFESNLLKARVGNVYDPTNMRLLLWQAALKQFQLNPIVGTGSGSYLFLGRHFRSPGVQADPIHVHCDYLELLAEYGIIGVALAGLFLWTHLRSGFKGVGEIVKTKLQPVWETSSNEVALVIGALSAIIALLGHSLVDFNFHIPANTLLAAFLFAILARPTRAADGSEAAGRKERGRWLRWFAPIAGAVMMVLAWWRMPGEYFAERARVAMRNRQYLESQKLAVSGLAYEKNNPDLFYYLGEATRGRSYEEPEPVIRRALRETSAESFEEWLLLFPEDTRLLLKFGEALDILGRYREADSIFRRAIPNDPNFGNVYAYYGFHWLTQRRQEEARLYFSKALDLGSNEIAARGMQEIDRMEKDPLLKLRQELFPAQTNEPGGSTILPSPTIEPAGSTVLPSR